MATKAEIIQGGIDFFRKKIDEFNGRIDTLKSQNGADTSIRLIESDIESFENAIARFQGYLDGENA